MLEGKTIWVTRPEGQADMLTGKLEQAGARVCKLPMLAIEPLPEDADIKARVLDLDHYQLLFFISTNAAGLGMDLIENYWPQFPVQLDVFSVGPTTASLLESRGLKVHYPEQRMTSEALLALPALADIGGKKALIVRGVGGRDLLATELKKRGGSVDYLELYRRVCPAYASGEIGDAYRQQRPDAVVMTSAEALANFKDLLDRDNLNPPDVPLYVSSGRIAEQAKQMGFVQTRTMPGADDTAIIDSLKESL